MAKRIITQIGDIFCVEFDDGKKGYFQYIANDLNQMNSSVIRAFKTHHPIDKEIKIEDIVQDEVAFYAHTILKDGVDFNIWCKVGKSCEIGEKEINKVVFGYILDHISTLEDINENKDIFASWVIWHIEDKKWINIGNLPRNYHSSLELGGIYPASEIKGRMHTGYYKYTNPAFSIIKRIPRTEYDSFLRKETFSRIIYYHFKGEFLIDSFVLLKGEEIQVKEHNSFNNLKFWDINWKYLNFISYQEFNSVKEQYLDSSIKL